VRQFRLLLALLIFLPFVGRCEVTNLTNEQLQQWIARGVPVVDIRTPAEWKETGVIKGSHLLTFFDESGRANVDAWMAQFSKIAGPGDAVVLVCRSGNRTGQVTRFLDQNAGYRKIAHLQKGISIWIAAGNPVVRP
jgi:rhodanese-related sulfurtransferase